MTSARRKARRTYHGLVEGKRPRGGVYTGGARRTGVKATAGKGAPPARGGRTILLEPRIKPNGKWGYRFKKLRGFH